MIHTVLFVCLTVETADKKKTKLCVPSVCLFLADKFVCNGCQRFWRTKTVSAIEDGVFFLEQGALHLKEPLVIFFETKQEKKKWFS